ncbi:MAG: ABC transporter ATP-binding protein [Clostridia bacterium]|nr:ABC transporter ATP-binding protein [Clostridia bacterium]
MLKIDGLTKKFGEKTAVDNISLEVLSGQICAFIGHNGAGKTTALRCISGIITFDEGHITVDGIDVKEKPLEAKKQIAYLPDNPELYEHLKGIDYLNFIADIFGVSESDRKQRIEDYAKKLEIYNDLSSLISSYSHGMKQKLALVSALIHKPKLLLLDEPFVGLDPTASHQFKLIMQQLASEGSAIFYSTHVLEVAEKICSHVVIIKNGKLIAQGTMEEVKGMKSLESIFLEMENETNA